MRDAAIDLKLSLDKLRSQQPSPCIDLIQVRRMAFAITIGDGLRYVGLSGRSLTFASC
jgi:hypothetical protein